MNAAQIKEMMDNWNKTEAAVRAACPAASDEQVYQLTAAAMNKSLGL
ncbi:hypothetical protein [Burkholderia ambifaria]|nr:hypothetical protein [Burkholderia ambifaria]